MPSPVTIAVALDIDDTRRALATARVLAPEVDYIKVGPPLVVKGGMRFLETLALLGPGLFIDLKFHDIPSTVERSIKCLAPLPVSLLTVHTLGGPAMLSAAARSAAAAPFPAPPAVLGVTVLTSMDPAQLARVGIAAKPMEEVAALARLAAESGCAGVVCSPHEAARVREECGANFLIVTPGIRPENSPAGDQARAATPREAVAAGADCLVVGRPVIESPDPRAAVRAIRASVSRAP